MYKKEPLDNFEIKLRNQKNEILVLVQGKIYETMEQSMDFMRIHYEEESKNHRIVLSEAFRDDMLGYGDEIKSLRDRVEIIEQIIHKNEK